MQIRVFSQGKIPEKNEDSYGHNESTFVVADGATDKSGRLYGGKTGGDLLSDLIVEKSLFSNSTGTKLTTELNAATKELYNRICPEAITDAQFRFSSTVVVAKILQNKLIITQVGDTSFRINQIDMHAEQDLHDRLTAGLRSEYINLTKDVEHSRDFILPLLKNQFYYQNNGSSPLGYGCIDGTKTPDKFVNAFSYDLHKVHSLEIFTDGYFAVPENISIEAWEEKAQQVEKEDPFKCLQYKSTKAKDDRTVMIINFA
jgi:hypothetical protein